MVVRSAAPEWLPLAGRRRDRRGDQLHAAVAEVFDRTTQSALLSSSLAEQKRWQGHSDSPRPRVHWRLCCWIFRGSLFHEFTSEFIVGSSAAAVFSMTLLSASSGRLRSLTPSSSTDKHWLTKPVTRSALSKYISGGVCWDETERPFNDGSYISGRRGRPYHVQCIGPRCRVLCLLRCAECSHFWVPVTAPPSRPLCMSPLLVLSPWREVRTQRFKVLLVVSGPVMKQ